MRLYFIIILVILSFLSNSLLIGQNNGERVIIGKITDTAGWAISNANVVLSRNVGTTSDNFGFFLIKTRNSTNEVKVSHIGYESQKRKVSFDLNSGNSDTTYIRFSLKPNTEQINAFTVTAEASNYYYRDLNSVLLDYYVENGDLRLLIKKGNRHFLRVCVENLPQKDIKLDFRPLEFYRDCMNNQHIIAKDSIYQVFINNYSMNIIYTASIKEFKEKLEPCIATFSEEVVFQQYEKYNQRILYFSINRKNRRKNKFTTVSNKIGQLYASDLRKDLIVYYMQHVPERENIIALGVWNGNVDDLAPPDRDFFERMVYYKKIASKPIYSPAFIYGDSLLVFNHVDGLKEVYSQFGKELNKIPIEYHKTKHWDEQIIKDNKSFYATFYNNGIISLKKIDLKTGKLKKHTEISGISNPDKLKIFNGFAYCIKRNQAKSAFELFKIQLN